MGYTLTRKSQVTMPKAVREHLGVGPGQAVDYEMQPDGRVLIVAAAAGAAADENPFLKFLGIGITGLSTEEILRETRGDDCMR